MIKQGFALAALFASLIAVSASQLVIKARFEALGLTTAGSVAWDEALWRMLADPLLWAGAGLVVLGSLGWYLAMTSLPVSFMLPVSALISPLVAIGAYFCLGESLGASKIAAILVIAAGVVWLGSQSA